MKNIYYEFILFLQQSWNYDAYEGLLHPSDNEDDYGDSYDDSDEEDYDQHLITLIVPTVANKILVLIN